VRNHRQLQRLGQRRGGFAGTQQVRAVDGGQILALQGLGQARGLPASHGVERHVQVALDAHLGIPGRLPVAQHEQPGGFFHGGGH
jgi:hypothetical protein